MLSNFSQRTICTAILLLITSSVVAQNLPTNGTLKHHKTATNQSVPQPPAAAYYAPQFISQPYAAAAPKDEPHRWYEWFWPPEWASWALVVVAIWAAYIALDTLQDLKVQTENTRIASEAAQKSVELAEKSLKLSERADVLLNKTALVLGKEADARDARIDIEFQNFGRTRAVNVCFRLNILIQGKPVSDARFLAPVSMGANKSYTVSTTRLDKFIPVADIPQVMAETKILRFVCDVLYEDIFGEKHTVLAEGTLDVARSTFRIEKEETQ